MIGRILLVAPLLAGAVACNAAKERDAESPRPVAACFDVGSGSPDAIARRSARELADSELLAELGPRAGDSDRRFAVRFGRMPLGSGSQPAFESMLADALLATGSFLLVDDPAAPAIHARVAGRLGDERSSAWITGPAGDVWVDVRGRIAPAN